MHRNLHRKPNAYLIFIYLSVPLHVHIILFVWLHDSRAVIDIDIAMFSERIDRLCLG